MSKSISETIKQLKKDQQLKKYGIENKGDWKRNNTTYNDAIAAVAEIHVSRRSDAFKRDDLKKLGLSVKDREEIMQSLKGRGTSEKELRNRFKLNKEMAEKVYNVTKGGFINKSGLREALKKVEKIRRRNVAISVRARDEEDAMMAQSLTNRRQKGQKNAISSMENEDSGRLGVSGMEYSAGIGSKKVSTQDFRGKRSSSITSTGGSRTSGAGVARSGGVLNQGKGAASIAGGLGARQMPGGGGGRGAAPLGFK